MLATQELQASQAMLVLQAKMDVMASQGFLGTVDQKVRKVQED